MAMTEVKYAHQNVGFEAIDPAAGKFLVKNRFYFTNLKKYMISYTVKARRSNSGSLFSNSSLSSILYKILYPQIRNL